MKKQKNTLLHRSIIALASVFLIFWAASCTPEDDFDNHTPSSTDTITTGGDTPTDTTSYTLNVHANNEEWGVVTGSGTYINGTTVNIEAVPTSGYYFIKWSDDVMSNPRMVTVSSELTLYALFSSNPNDSTPYNPDDWVDLGLPSGLLWAKCDLGATTPEEYGNHYAWGETQPKSNYNKYNYQWYNWDESDPGQFFHITKYCQDPWHGYNNYTDNFTTIQPEDDAATMTHGQGARIPTRDEWNELRFKCRKELVSQNGVQGVRLTGSNGNTIFIPNTGGEAENCGEEFHERGVQNYYWTATLDTNAPYFAYIARNSGGSINMPNGQREYGSRIRAVYQKQN